MSRHPIFLFSENVIVSEVMHHIITRLSTFVRTGNGPSGCTNCNRQVKGGHYAHARVHRHARTLPNPEALGQEIEEGAVLARYSPGALLLRWKVGELNLISKNSHRHNQPPDRALGSDESRVNSYLCPPLTFL